MATAALPDVLSQYLKTCTPKQIAAIISNLPAFQTEGAATVTANASNGSMNSLAPTKAKKRKLASDDKAGKPSRPLNSWMAFRSYYSPIFMKTQQKAISGLMTKMWKEDPFKAKWTVLASAYSAIRDNVAKSDAPLDEFLRISAPYIGIIEPVAYLEVLGWKITKLEADVTALVRVFTPDLNSFDASIRTSNLSVDDLADRCYEIGYIALENLNAIKTRSLSMAMNPAMTVAQPAVKKVKAAPTQSSPPQEQPAIAQSAINSGNDFDFTTLGAIFQPGNASTTTAELPQVAAEVGHIVSVAETQLAAADGMMANDFSVQHPNANGHGASATVYQQQFTIAEPDYSSFHPDYDFGTPSFDPLVGDAFDIYDITNPEELLRNFLANSVFDL
ncbi:hypothetical protein W97_06800 [Coniosporium apollinis CBS 100218]|uniref:Mating-type protein MAT-1 n=1 Tax=Coniosporium apollinis (strain CBS 100218) TaxID=1168221 RepID=R7Z0I5_CONA1|nr:uncharacterized protein W97_06800 [Coniosporium apollinis CBS 100218]EON67657.1 hypothetical protein W97_06800 [Coniosporium apollinis CBS 100218]